MSSDLPEYPYDTVVYITDTIGGEQWQGSGVLISPDEVLTASHVVYSSTYGSAYNITVTPDYNAGSEPDGTATATDVHFNEIQDPGDTITTQQSQYDYAVIHLSEPFTNLGTMGIQPNFAGGSVNVTGYPGSADGQLVSSQQSVTLDRYYSIFDGTGIGAGSSGGPVWITGSDGNPYVVGLVSSGDGSAGGAGFFTQITTAAYDQIESWVAQDDDITAGEPAIVAEDTTTQTAISPTVQPYVGPVSGLQEQFLDVSTDNLNISVNTPNWFIHSGSGDDAITVSSGTNVLDGGTGSNFLTGGTGSDTFYVDDRFATADIWDTVNNFHAGDSATIWGVTQQDFDLNWANWQGAAGYLGLTLHATAAGIPTASLTLVGFTKADLSDGRLSVSFGTVEGNAFMYVHDNV